MQRMQFEFPASRLAVGRAHVGVVSSGDLELLVEPSHGDMATIRVCTSVSGYDVIWQATLARFFSRMNVRVDIEINDFGATPGMVLLRLQQALAQMERCDG